MPSFLIETRCDRPQDQEIALLDAVHSALVEAFKIPANDKHGRLVVHAPHRFVCPPTLTTPELYTQISIQAFSGRSLDAKRALYRAVVRNLEALDIRPSHVLIVLQEVPRENWGIRGGQAGSDVELGFKVEV